MSFFTVTILMSYPEGQEKLLERMAKSEDFKSETSNVTAEDQTCDHTCRCHFSQSSFGPKSKSKKSAQKSKMAVKQLLAGSKSKGKQKAF